jgi:hypothetical protein
MSMIGLLGSELMFFDHGIPMAKASDKMTEQMCQPTNQPVKWIHQVEPFQEKVRQFEDWIESNPGRRSRKLTSRSCKESH